METNKVQAIYQELQGYLAQIPPPKEAHITIDFDPIGNQVNTAIDELNQVTGNDYAKFRIIPQCSDYGYRFVNITGLRSMIGGLIDRLHAEFFSKEARPFGIAPQTVISNSQTQVQNLSLVLDIQWKIMEKLQDQSIKPEEKNFLERLKGSLATVTSATELFGLILNLANQSGLTLEALKQVLKL